MPTRTLTAQQPGPVLIDARLLGAGGVVTVRTDPTRTEAEITVHTADDTGEFADAVRDADLHWDSRGVLTAHVQGNGDGGGMSGSGVFITGDNYGGVVQSVQNNYGSIVMVSGRDLNISSGQSRFQYRDTLSTIRGGSPITITAVVPEGSSVTASTHSADVTAEGTFAEISASTKSGDLRAPGQSERVTARTQSGDIDVENSPTITARTISGDVRLGRTDLAEATTVSGDVTIRDFGGTAQLKSTSGDIRIHATAGGDITAKTVSGDITVTGTEQAVTDDLDVHANSMTGEVRIPRSRHNTGTPRRRSS
ncbi:hypothetical protein GCM10010232_66060 [Streptomyces amakusaensis]|uniref:DUF4097 domain-containing protein n=1 Tax=Streptomyces amakusaensis TaxID=67271 RepID=A0ABW0AUQ1_9ACTN